MGFFDSVLDFGKSLIKPLTGGLIDLGGSYAANQLIGQPNAARAYADSKEAADTAWARQRLLYRNRYQWTARDMELAGLNPILAASGGFSVGNAPSVASAQAFKADNPYGTFASSAKNFMDASKGVEEIENIKADTDKKRKETLESIARTVKARSEAGLADAKEREAAQNVFVLEQRVYQMAKEISLMDSQIEETNRRADLEQQQVQVAKQQEQKLNVEKRKLLLEAQKLYYSMKELSARSSVYDGWIGKLNGALKETLSMFGLNFGLITGLKK